ncbi:MAG: fasciclin domain-containing protein, partial [Luminiphilus sp.]|nr:fasciclin domain-containing protein [Luminiphilus sp.]
MNSITRIISHALVASLMVFLAACSESGDGVLYEDDLPTVEAPAAPTPDPGPGNIVEVATESGSFPTLLAAVEAAGLVDALSDSSASLTVFAPTEAAFAALPEGTLDSLLADPDALANVLTYHVLGSSVDASAALGLAPTTVGTLNGAKVAVTTRNDENLYVNYSKVVDYDIEASNGVIHVVDSVLLPPDLTPSALTIAEIASADENFSTLVAALTAANLVGAVSDPDAALTVFAPTNAAFDALGEGAVPFLLNNLELLEQILLYHVLGAEVTSIDAIVAAGSDVTMLNGEDATISLSEGGQGLMINGSNIVVTDIVAANGIIHVIDAVLGTDDLELGEEDTGILGTWQLAPEAGSLGVGPAEFDVSWWNGDDGVIALRDCLYDDEFVFSRDGSFKNVLGDTTWVEGWQGGADSCAAPVAPHDGSNQATFEYDEEAMTLTLTGQGAYMGIPKPVNGAELASPAAAPEIVIYNAYAQEDGSLVLSIEAGAGVWWNYKLVKTAEPPPPS